MRIYNIDASMKADIQNVWSAYSTIRDSEIIVVINEDKVLTQMSVLAIFYAMTLKLPIIFYDIPRFEMGTYPFFKETIIKRLNKLVVANINTLDPEDAATLLNSSSLVNYTLTKREVILGRSYTLSQLRSAILASPHLNPSPYPELAIPSRLQPLSS